MRSERPDAPLNPSHSFRRRPSLWRNDLVAPFALVALVFLTFFPALFNGFVGWDDDKIVLDNPHIRSFSPGNMRWMWSSFLLGHHQPLTWITYGIDYAVWGLNPFGYHLTNVALHAVAAALFYYLARALIRAALAGRAAQASLPLTAGAWCAAALFAVHPLRVEAVAWVTGRRDALCAIFALATVMAYARHGEIVARTRVSRRRFAWFAASASLFVLAILSKAVVVTLPAVLLAIDVYPLRRIGPGRWLARETRTVWREKVILAGVAAPFGVIAVIAARSIGASAGYGEYGPGQRLAQAAYGLAFYLWKTVWPSRLSPLYELSTGFNALEPRFIAGVLTVVVVTIILIARRRRWPGATAAGAAYLTLSLPTLGLAQVGPQLVADRYSYFPCMGWAILAGGAVTRILLQSPGRTAGRRVAALALVCASMAVIALSLNAWRQTRLWKDSETLWSYALSIDPGNSIANYNLGNVRLAQNRLRQAEELYRRALDLRPTYPEAANNLGLALWRQGAVSEAARWFRRSLELDPSNETARANLREISARAR